MVVNMEPLFFLYNLLLAALVFCDLTYKLYLFVQIMLLYLESMKLCSGSTLKLPFKIMYVKFSFEKVPVIHVVDTKHTELILQQR